MTNHLIRFKLFALAILFATISISVNAQAQAPSAGPNESGGTALRTELRLSDLLAEATRNRRPSTSNASSSTTSSRTGPFFNTTAAVAGLPVTGSGTLGRVTKWVSSGSTSVIGDTTIFEDKYGKVGVGTDTPTSRLAVVGTIESSSGGFKFPDGSVQTTSAAGAIASVTHNATLVGAGTALSPLQVASPLEVRDRDNPARQPFQLIRNLNNLPGDSEAITTFAVPAGKRFVLEYISVEALSIPRGNSLIVSILSDSDGLYSLPISPVIPIGSSDSIAIVAQQVRIYAESFLNFRARWHISDSSVGARVGFSGYFVDLP